MKSRWLVGVVLFCGACSAQITSRHEDLSVAADDLAIADDLLAAHRDLGGPRDLRRGADLADGADLAAADLSAPPVVVDLAKPAFAAGTICNDTGVARAAPATLPHLIVILFENKNFGSVNGNASAPYISSLATACGHATAYADNCFTDNLISLPHYLALTSGSNCDTGLEQTGTGCIVDDADATAHTLSTASIFSQASSWRSYQEGMATPCAATSGGLYATKHNPAAYYSALASCATYDVSIPSITCSTTTLTKCTPPSNAFTDDLANDTLAAFTFITPNLVNDMHDGTVTQGDNWLYTYLPLVLASKAYLRGDVAVLVLWDEQSSASFGGATPNVFVSPYITAGTVTATTINHFSVLRAMEDALGIPTHLGCASGTQPGGGACPTGSTADVRAAIGF